MLEVQFFDIENESKPNMSRQFALSKLTNGNYALAKFSDYQNLITVLQNWKEANSILWDPEERYEIYLSKY